MVNVFFNKLFELRVNKEQCQFFSGGKTYFEIKSEIQKYAHPGGNKEIQSHKRLALCPYNPPLLLQERCELSEQN